MKMIRPPDGKHVVQDGEWVGGIAADYGYGEWRNRIWLDPANAKLRKTRNDDPHILAEGDILFIPEIQVSYETCATELRHRFRNKNPKAFFRFRLISPDGAPLKNTEYKLVIEMRPGYPQFEQQNFETDEKGNIKESISPGAMEAQLTIPALGRVFRLKIGFLSPIDPTENSQNVRGVQERLKSLGFDPGPIDGINGNRTRAALGAFQSYCANEENRKRDPERIIDSGPVDGILGKKTLNALIKAFGS